jgi:hypothetical protein
LNQYPFYLLIVLDNPLPPAGDEVVSPGWLVSVTMTSWRLIVTMRVIPLRRMWGLSPR